MPGTMSEWKSGTTGCTRVNDRRMRDTAKRQDRPQSRHGPDLCNQKLVAGPDLLCVRTIGGRYATNRIGYPAVDQYQTIIRTCTVHAVCESGLQQCRIEERPGTVARERSAGPVGPAKSWCQTHDKKSCIMFTKTRNRCIVPIRFLFAPLVAKVSEARTKGTVPFWYDSHARRSQLVLYSGDTLALCRRLVKTGCECSRRLDCGFSEHQT